MKIYGLIKEASDELLWNFTHDVHKLILDKYFSTYWRGDTKDFSHTGHEVLSNKVKEHNPKNILDVGCGYNDYKKWFDEYEFVGIDPYNDKADIKQGIYEYYQENKEKQFDAILALGSINFGPYDKILQEVEWIDKLTAPGGRSYWRVNPGLPHKTLKEFPLVDLIEFFDWTKEFIEKLAEVFGYEIEEYAEETNHNGDKRIYFCFHKL
jgi:hypothetical protein